MERRSDGPTDERTGNADDAEPDRVPAADTLIDALVTIASKMREQIEETRSILNEWMNDHPTCVDCHLVYYAPGQGKRGMCEPCMRRRDLLWDEREDGDYRDCLIGPSV